MPKVSEERKAQWRGMSAEQRGHVVDLLDGHLALPHIRKAMTPSGSVIAADLLAKLHDALDVVAQYVPGEDGKPGTDETVGSVGAIRGILPALSVLDYLRKQSYENLSKYIDSGYHPMPETDEEISEPLKDIQATANAQEYSRLPGTDEFVVGRDLFVGFANLQREFAVKLDDLKGMVSQGYITPEQLAALVAGPVDNDEMQAAVDKADPLPLTIGGLLDRLETTMQEICDRFGAFVYAQSVKTAEALVSSRALDKDDEA